MTIKEVIKELEDLGMSVSFYKRKDGGIRITRINGETFRGSTGNTRARTIVGASLSEGQKIALSRLTTPKGKGSYNKRRKAPIDEETKKRIAKLQRQYRKSGKKEGKPTLRNYRYVLKTKGKKEADRLLKQSERRILGIAYTENVNALLSRLKMDIRKLRGKQNVQYLEMAYNKILEQRDSFPDRKIYPIYEILYDLEMGVIDAVESGERILTIIDS